MTSAGPTGYSADGQPPGLAGGPRHGPEPWRLGAAALIVATVVAAIWLWGRPHAEPPAALAAITSEAWMAGQPPGAFELVEVAAQLAEQLADPSSIPGSVATHDLPSGTLVTPALLGVASDASGALTAMRFPADTSAWPAPGPGAGSRAVVAGVLGGCALDVTTLAGGAEGSIVVRVDAPGAARYANASELDGLVAWPAPPDGWPECRSPGAGNTLPWSGYGSGASPGFDRQTPPGFGSEAPSATPSGNPAEG
ncbi:MAG: hypothetical protein OXB99_03895 [Acidimicrobiaceae bacterium]|nr:hypothetical protein [Acidimicrobiaceae bacterium]